MGENVLVFAAQKQTRNAAAPMRRHHDQIAGMFFCRGDDGLRHQVGFGADRLACNAFGLRRLLDGIDDKSVKRGGRPRAA